tara:strand:+ start:2647 stop:2850 length:204 start_codon:yes stop_codon:yes gene_type:complete
MTKIIEIISNQLRLDKQKLELELEKVINDNSMDVDSRVEMCVEILHNINKSSNAYVTLNSYINKNKE